MLLGLFAERSAFPRWIGNLIDSGEAQATGRLRVRVPAGGRVTGDDVARHLLDERLVEDLAITHASLDDVFLSLTDAGQPAPSEPQESLA